MSDQKRMTAAEFREAQLVDMSETDLFEEIRKLAKQTGWRIFHDYRADGAYEGFPDLVLARDGETIVAELKSVTGRWRPGQREWLAALAGDDPDDWHFNRVVHRENLIVACWTPLLWQEINVLLKSGRVREGIR